MPSVYQAPGQTKEDFAEAILECLCEVPLLRSGTEIRGLPSRTWLAITLRQVYISKVRVLAFRAEKFQPLIFEIACYVLNRKKDVGKVTASWFAELLSTDPWWKDLVPDV